METPTNAPRVEVLDRQTAHPVDRAGIERVARHVLVGAGSPLSLHVVLTDDEEIRGLNRRFLGHDEATDVLTFPFERGEEDPDGVGAEVVVSVETAVREARARELDPSLEIALYCVHGILHLLGFDDASEAAAARMYAETLRRLARAGVEVGSLESDLTGGGHG